MCTGMFEISLIITVLEVVVSYGYYVVPMITFYWLVIAIEV